MPVPWPVRTAVKGCGATRNAGIYELKKAIVHLVRTNTKQAPCAGLCCLLPSYERKGLTDAISSTASSSSSTSSSSSSLTAPPAAAAAMAIGCPSTIHGSSRVANEGRRRAGGAPGAGGRCVRSSGTGSPFGGGAGRVLAWSGAMRPTRRLAGEATCGGYADARCPKAQGAAPAVLGAVLGAVLSAFLGVVQAATASVPLPSQTLAPTLPLMTPTPPPVHAPGAALGAALGAVLGGCSADHGSERDANASFRHPRRRGMPAAAATAAAAKSTDAAAAAADDDDDADADDELVSLWRLALFHSPAPWWALFHSPCTAGKPRLRCSASMRRTCACIRGGAPAKLACRCDGRCSKAAGVPSSTQAPSKIGRMRGAISEWQSYVINKGVHGHQRS